MSLRLLASAVLTLCLILPTAHAEQPSAKTPHGIDRSEWNAPQKPLRIYANTWYVGPFGLSSILLDTGQGLALFDGDLPESATQIEAHIRELGFRVRDVKWILNSHAHSDHAGGIVALQAASGAQVFASAAGARELELGGVIVEIGDRHAQILVAPLRGAGRRRQHRKHKSRKHPQHELPLEPGVDPRRGTAAPASQAGCAVASGRAG